MKACWPSSVSVYIPCRDRIFKFCYGYCSSESECGFNGDCDGSLEQETDEQDTNSGNYSGRQRCRYRSATSAGKENGELFTEEVIKNIIEEFSLSDEEAEKYMKMYW